MSKPLFYQRPWRFSGSSPKGSALTRKSSARAVTGAAKPTAWDRTGVRKIIRLLFRRAGLEGFKGHDLRRTFATLVTEAGGDEFVATRLLRDKVPGQSDRYINYPAARLREHLAAYSPLRHLDDPMKPARSRQPTPPPPDETAPVPLDAAPKSIEHVKGGETRSPRAGKTNSPANGFLAVLTGELPRKTGDVMVETGES
jgi:hypothetical protein